MVPAHLGSPGKRAVKRVCVTYGVWCGVLWTRRVRRPSHQPRYLHSSVLLGRLMLVYGGNTHNDTSAGRYTKCYSSSFMAYDLGMPITQLV